MASWWFASSDAEQDFTNTSYAEKHTLDFTAPAEGDYLIVVTFSGITNNTASFLYYRAQLDDTITIMEGQHETSDTFWGDYPNVATVYLAESLSAGSHSVDLDAYVNSNTGYISYAKIAVLRLDDWLSTAGMYAYAATEAAGNLTTSFTTFQTLTFTPDTEGAYLVLGSAELTPASTSLTADVRLNYDAGSEYLPIAQAEETPVSYAAYEGKDTGEYQAWVWGGIVTIPASEKTILMEGLRTSSNGGTIRKRRLIAIRLAAMDSGVESTEDATISSTSAEWVDKSTLTFTPASTEDYFLIGAQTIKPDNISMPSQGRFEHTVGTSTGTIDYYEMDSKDADDPADCIPAFSVEIKELGNTEQTFKTQFGDCGASNTHYAKGSFIIAIRKPAAAVGADIQLIVDGGVLQLMVDGGVIQKIVD